MIKFIAIVAIVVAVIALVVAAIKGLIKLSPGKQFEIASEAAAKAAERAKELSDAYNDVKTSLESIEEKQKALEEMTYGTQEWRDAVRELNNEILSMVQKNPQYAAFL